METKDNSNWDTYDFQDWVVRNINLILGGKELELFRRNNFGYDDLKLFGKIEEAENLKSAYQSSILDKVFQFHQLDSRTIQNLVGEDYKWISINY